MACRCTIDVCQSFLSDSDDLCFVVNDMRDEIAFTDDACSASEIIACKDCDVRNIALGYESYDVRGNVDTVDDFYLDGSLEVKPRGIICCAEIVDKVPVYERYTSDCESTLGNSSTYDKIFSIYHQLSKGTNISIKADTGFPAEQHFQSDLAKSDACLQSGERSIGKSTIYPRIRGHCSLECCSMSGSESKRASGHVVETVDQSQLRLHYNLRLLNTTFSKFNHSRRCHVSSRSTVYNQSKLLKILLRPLTVMLILLLASSTRALEDVFDSELAEQYELERYEREQERFEHQRVKVYGGASERQSLDSTTYLMRYGYLPGSDLETGALRTEAELTRAVLEFQRNANIPETGRLDEMTLKAMRRSRCGVTDVLPSHGHLNGHTNRYSEGRSDIHHSARRRGDHKIRHEDGRQRNRRERRLRGEGETRTSRYRGTRSAEMVPQEYTLGPSVWQKKWLTFRIMNFTPDLDRYETRDAIIRAFHLWSDVTQLTFHEVESGHADIYLQFASGYHNDGYTFDGQGMVLAHAFFPGEDRGGDVHFDEDETWTVRTHQGVNLYTVVAHELGHSLGLAHSYVPGSLMYPWHRGYDPNLSLHQDDVTAIQYLYGARDRNTSDPAHAPPITVSVTPPTTTTTMTSVKTTAKPVVKVTKATVAKDPNAEPDRCSSTFDSLSLIRGDVFAFTGKWFWRISKDGVLSGYPVLISRFWFGLPDNISKIDAALERPGNGHIVFFSGNKYFEFYGNTLLQPYSPNGRPITEFGLPADLKGIDAAFVWAHNQRIYLIKDTMYWKLDDAGKMVEYGYPRDMSMWGDVPLPVDAAFTYTNHQTYFFHEGSYYEFNNVRMNVRKGYPRPLTSRWLGCKNPPTLSPDQLWHGAQRAVNVAIREKQLELSLFISMTFASFAFCIHSLN